MWVQKVVLIVRCLEKGESESEELAFLQQMKCVPSFDKVDEAPSFVCLQLATAGSAEKEHDMEEE